MPPSHPNLFHLANLVAPALDSTLLAISDRGGQTAAERAARSDDAETLIMAFQPCDAIELVLAGQVVMFNELLADSARDVLRGMVDTMKQRRLSTLISAARVTQGNLDRLQKRGIRPHRTEIAADDAAVPDASAQVATAVATAAVAAAAAARSAARSSAAVAPAAGKAASAAAVAAAPQSGATPAMTSAVKVAPAPAAPPAAASRVAASPDAAFPSAASPAVAPPVPAPPVAALPAAALPAAALPAAALPAAASQPAAFQSAASQPAALPAAASQPAAFQAAANNARPLAVTATGQPAAIAARPSAANGAHPPGVNTAPTVANIVPRIDGRLTSGPERTETTAGGGVPTEPPALHGRAGAFAGQNPVAGVDAALEFAARAGANILTLSPPAEPVALLRPDGPAPVQDRAAAKLDAVSAGD